MMDISQYYVEKGQGAPLILLHGNGEDSSYFVHQMEPFAQHFRVIALDTRGHGRTPRGEAPFTIRQFAEDLLGFLDEHHIDKAHLLGFSDGGNIALVFALAHPDRVGKLVLNGANLDPSGVKRSVQIPIEIGYRIAKFFARFAEGGGPSGSTRSTECPGNVKPVGLSVAAKVGDSEEKRFANSEGKRFANSEGKRFAGADDSVDSADFEKKRFAGARKKAELLGLMANDPNVNVSELARIQSPTLVIAGTDDMIEEQHTRLIASNIPGARLVFIEGNHYIAANNPTDFNPAVLGFLLG